MARRVIGIYGGICSGKSLARTVLAEEFNVGTLDLDSYGHRAYAKGTPGHGEVLAAFPGVAGPDGEIDRKKLGAVVFGEKAKLQQLSSIVWPRIAELADADLRRLKGLHPAVAVEGALLLEGGHFTQHLTDLWLFYVSREEATRRLTTARGLTADEAAARLDQQASNETRFRLVEEKFPAEETRWVLDRSHATIEEAKEAIRAKYRSYVSKL